MSDQEYDDTNKGAAFQPFRDQELLLQGKLDVDGNEFNVVIVRQPIRRGGDPVLKIYQEAGVMFPNDSDNEKAPAYSGPLNIGVNLRVAAWRRESKNGSPFLSMAVSEKQSDAGTKPDDGSAHDRMWKNDDVPF